MDERDVVLWSASTDNAKVVWGTIASLDGGKGDAHVRCRARPTGIEFYVADETKGLEGTARIDEDSFSAFECGGEDLVEFRVSMRSLLGCLQVFGGKQRT